MIASTRLAQQVRDSQGKLLKQRAYFDLNPTGKGHWTNRLFGQLRDPVSLQPLINPHDYARMFMNPRDNAANLSQEYLDSLASLPERQRRRFSDGGSVQQAAGALLTYARID